MKTWLSPKKIKQQLFQNIANIVTIIGFLATIQLAVLFIANPEHLGQILFWAGLVAFSDLIDGFLARRLKIESRFGQAADRIRDKLYIGVAVIGSAFRYWPAKRKVLPLANLTEALVILILLVESLLSVAWFVGLKKKLDIKASQAGRKKMFFESFAVLGWFVSLGAEKYLDWNIFWFSIYFIDITFFMAAYYARESLEGYWRKYKEVIGR